MMSVDHYITTADGHELAIYVRGNRRKPPVLFLHGGPGGHISESSFDFFDLEQWCIIAFDQRGCGHSKPFAALEHNDIFSAVADIEQIRTSFSIDSWLVFGGSYGSTLALTYAIAHPQRVTALVLRGIFLGRDEDVAWLYQEGASYFFPEQHEQFRTMIEESQQHDLVQAYYRIFLGDDEALKRKAAKRWADWEGSIIRLLPPDDLAAQPITDADISIALLECHFFANHMSWDDDNYILRHSVAIRDIPTYIVHGRYDVDCRLIGAYQLAHVLNDCHITIVEASGHSPYEPAMFATLQRIMHDAQLMRND